MNDLFYLKRFILRKIYVISEYLYVYNRIVFQRKKIYFIPISNRCSVGLQHNFLRLFFNRIVYNNMRTYMSSWCLMVFVWRIIFVQFEIYSEFDYFYLLLITLQKHLMFHCGDIIGCGVSWDFGTILFFYLVNIREFISKNIIPEYILYFYI